ncbi:MAG: NUDIX domain-containing protein [Bacteroidales bacterium]|nr:NUDIX domain-containing protein [Bacteroidales bacterium]
MLKVDFHSPDFLPDCGLTFVIIGARYKGNWIFIRHKHRKAYELPAGHINHSEEAGDAARRELEEETGALKYTIECIATYTVSEDGKARAGRLYYAVVRAMSEEVDDNEVDEVLLCGSLPQELSFPYVQAALFAYLEKYHARQINSR